MTHEQRELKWVTLVLQLLVVLLSFEWSVSAMVAVTSSPVSFRDQYRLVDYGAGMRLEQFGRFRVCRPCPIAANERRLLPESEWAKADLTFHLGDGAGNAGYWTLGGRVVGEDEPALADWKLSCGDHVAFALNAYKGGQVGLFPEQLSNWQWIGSVIREYLTHCESDGSETFNVLNGFAYTGGSTMAALVDPRVQVTHLDAAKTSVAAAKRNLGMIPAAHAASVRWIVDDCLTFTGREIKRRSDPAGKATGYRGLIFDPPAFGRDNKGRTWKINKDMPRLFDDVAQLLHPAASFVLVSCHDPAWPSKRLEQELLRVLPPALQASGRIEVGPLHILQRTPSTRRLFFGSFVRWARSVA